MTIGEQQPGDGSSTLAVKRAERRLRHSLAPVLADHVVTFEHWQVLAALHEHPGQRMTELAENAVLPPATLTRHVDLLVSRALVVRRVDTADRRRVAVALSTLGERLVERALRAERSALPGAAPDVVPSRP